MGEFAAQAGSREEGARGRECLRRGVLNFWTWHKNLRRALAVMIRRLNYDTFAMF